MELETKARRLWFKGSRDLAESAVSVQEEENREIAMADSEKHLLQLNGTNYQRWRFEIEAVLESREVMDVVLGNDKKPTDPNKKDELKTWRKQDAVARTLLSKSMDDEHHAFIRSCKSAAEIWSTITNLKEQATESTKLLVSQEFHGYRWEPGMSVSSFLSGLSVINGKMESVGVKVDEPSIIGKVLHSLPIEFDSFRQSWRLTSTNTSTYAKLQSQLLAAEADMRARDPLASSGEAFFGTGKSAGKGTKPGVREDGQKGKKKQKETRKCFNCNKVGHISKDCRQPKKESEGFNKSERKPQESGSGYMVFDHVMVAHEQDQWIGDSGAFAHITSRREWFDTMDEVSRSIRVGGDRMLQCHGIGTIRIQVFDGHKWNPSVLNEVRYVPDFGSVNLFSIGSAVSRGVKVMIDKDTIELKRNGRIEVIGKRNDGNMFIMGMKVESSGSQAMMVQPDSMKVWHERLGHIGISRIQRMAKGGMVDGLTVSNESDKFFCKGCVLGTMSKRSHPTVKDPRKCEPGEFIHSDVVGPFSESSIGGNRYFVCFKDESSGYRQVYPMKDKSMVLEKFKEFVALVDRETGRKVKLIRSDNGTEYKNGNFRDFCRDQGIGQEFSPPYTPQSNGRAERENRTLIEKASAMIHAHGLPLRLWAEAVVTAAYLMNRVPNSSNMDTTPYSLWFKKKPSVSHLRIFGSKCFVHIDDSKRKKMEPKAKEGVFTGYGSSDKIYRIWDESRNSVDIVTNVKFDEQVSVKQPLLIDDFDDEESVEVGGELKGEEAKSDKVEESDGSEYEDTVTTSPTIPPPVKNAIRKPSLPLQVKLRDRIPKNYVNWVTDDPLTPDEALNREDGHLWLDAMKDEMNSLVENDTFDLVDRPKNRKIIKCRWVLKTKCKPDGSLDRRKARLVAKGFTQKHGIDYGETYSPVVRYESVRLFLSIVAAKDLDLVQFDVKTAFLHGTLKEEIYMEQPEVFDDGSEKVWKLNKGLYGLKQAPRCWNERIGEFLKSFGLNPTNSDKCIYVSTSGPCVILALYVDDGLLACESKNLSDSILYGLNKKFKITIGEPDCFVGIEILRDRGRKTISIHQSNYIRRVLDKYGWSEMKSARSPGDSKLKLSKSQCPQNEEEREFMADKPYAGVIGSLMFVVHCRPDIAFNVSKVAQFSKDPGPIHWIAVKRICRYLKGTVDYCITYGLDPAHPFTEFDRLRAYAFCDADWAGDIDKRRSTFGYVFMMNGGPVTWTSKLQKSTAGSSQEAEYVALAETSRESIWIRQFLTDLRHEQVVPIEVRSDNQGAISSTKTFDNHQRMKHVDVMYHAIRERVQDGIVEISYTPTDEQPADMLTKPLTSPSLVNCLNMLNMV